MKLIAMFLVAAGTLYLIERLDSHTVQQDALRWNMCASVLLVDKPSALYSACFGAVEKQKVATDYHISKDSSFP